MASTAAGVSERLACPVCGGHGTIATRAARHHGAARHQCGLCRGTGVVNSFQVQDLPRLRTQMQRVADLIQGGDADRAREASRVAFRIARAMMQARDR